MSRQIFLNSAALTAFRSGSAVFALDGTGAELAPTEWRIARVVNRHMRQIHLFAAVFIGARRRIGWFARPGAVPSEKTMFV